MHSLLLTASSDAFPTRYEPTILSLQDPPCELSSLGLSAIRNKKKNKSRQIHIRNKYEQLCSVILAYAYPSQKFDIGLAGNCQ